MEQITESVVGSGSSKTISKIVSALLKAHSEMSDPVKNAVNPYFKSSYADLNSAREAALPALNKYGITVIQPTIVLNGKNYVQTTLLHESGEYISSLTEIISAKANDPQAHGSGLSYARRYGFTSLLNLGAVDDDAESAVVRKETAHTVPVQSAPTTTTLEQAKAFLMPFGKKKGTPLANISTEDLASAADWVESKKAQDGKVSRSFEEFVVCARIVIAATPISDLPTDIVY
jgi:hypothetical protein